MQVVNFSWQHQMIKIQLFSNFIQDLFIEGREGAAGWESTLSSNSGCPRRNSAAHEAVHSDLKFNF